MKRKTFSIALLFCIISLLVYGWGFFGHKRINRMAVFTLPAQLMRFYKANIDFIEEHAVDPDKRRYAVKDEAARHYIDLDRYGESPLDSLPKNWKAAVEKYSKDTLMAHGIVPWHINVMLGRLTDAFRNKDYNKILRYSADLGHYVADAHVPLHCTQNYNGQFMAYGSRACPNSLPMITTTSLAKHRSSKNLWTTSGKSSVKVLLQKILFCYSKKNSMPDSMPTANMPLSSVEPP